MSLATNFCFSSFNNGLWVFSEIFYHLAETLTCFNDLSFNFNVFVLPFYAFPKWLHGFLFSQLHPQFKPPVQKKFLFGQKFDYFAICRSSEFVEIYDPEKIKGNKRVWSTKFDSILQKVNNFSLIMASLSNMCNMHNKYLK